MTLKMQDFKDYDVPANSMAVWWLSQASFVVKSPSGKIVIIDPYLTDACGPTSLEMGFDMRRMHPTYLEPEDVAGVGKHYSTYQ